MILDLRYSGMIGVCVLLAGGIVTEIAISGSDTVPPINAPPINLPPLPETLATVVAPVLSELIQRPVFSASRRPPPPAQSTAEQPAALVAPPPPLPEAAAKLRLVGIIDGPGQRIALIKPQMGQETSRLVEGDTIGEWKIDQILKDRVELNIRGVQQDLTFVSSSQSQTKSSLGPNRARSAPR